MNPLICALLATVAVGAEPEKPSPGDRMIDAYLTRLTRDQEASFLDGATTRAQWEAKRPRLRQEYLDMLGLWPLPEKTPLHSLVSGTIEHEGIVIERLHYQSRPGLYVTGNLYRPKEEKGRLPAILYVCGHSNRGRDGNKTAYQNHGLWFANHGYVCLTVDSLELGELVLVPPGRHGIHHGTYDLGRWWWQAAGYTPAGVECWNGIRGIDYLVSRPDVDPERVGVTGISGGGAATFWISAADERVKVAVPVSGMSDLECYVTDKVINGHCDCMFLVNTYNWQWTTIAALIAPRPLLFANSDNDTIFPMDGNGRVIERLRRLYAMYDRPDLVDAYVSKGGHGDRADLRVAAFQWFDEHLKHEMGAVGEVEFKQAPGKELRVFSEEKDLPTDAINARIDETFVPRAQVKLPEPGKFEEWKAGLLKELRVKSFRAFPERIPAARQVSAEAGIVLETEPGIQTRAVKAGEANTILIELDPAEDSKPEDHGYSGGLVYYPRGVAPSQAWTRKSPPNYVARSLALLGRTVDEGRVWDICATARYFKEQSDKRDIVLVGRGQAGVLAAYAALFEPAIKEVVLIDPPASHHDGPIFLNVLRVLDVPVALGMLAPRKLTLINAGDKVFDRTVEIYKRAGAADKIERK